MGFLRGVLAVFVCLVLILALLFVGVFATLNSSLKYDVVKTPLKTMTKGVITERISSEVIDQQQNLLNNYCKFNQNYNLYDSEIGYNLTIPCTIISQGGEEIIDYGIDKLINETYHKEYSCEFWKCFNAEGSPLFLISEYAKSYWQSNFYLFLFISFLLAGLVFLLIENKLNFLMIVGILLIIAFVPVALLDSIGKMVSKIAMSSISNGEGLNIIDWNLLSSIFFSKANYVFWKGLIIGLVLIGGAIFFKIFKFGLKINKSIGEKKVKNISNSAKNK